MGAIAALAVGPDAIRPGLVGGSREGKAQDGGAVTGIVVSYDSGVPRERVRLGLESGLGTWSDVKTESTGRFRFAGLAPGLYRLSLYSSVDPDDPLMGVDEDLSVVEILGKEAVDVGVIYSRMPSCTQPDSARVVVMRP